MPRYEHPDVSFDVPRDWEDRSVAAFSAPIPAGKKAGRSSKRGSPSA